MHIILQAAINSNRFNKKFNFCFEVNTYNIFVLEISKKSICTINSKIIGTPKNVYLPVSIWP